MTYWMEIGAALAVSGIAALWLGKMIREQRDGAGRPTDEQELTEEDIEEVVGSRPPPLQSESQRFAALEVDEQCREALRRGRLVP